MLYTFFSKKSLQFYFKTTKKNIFFKNLFANFEIHFWSIPLIYKVKNGVSKS